MPAIMELGSSCAAEFTVSLAPITRVKSVSVGQTITYKLDDFSFFKYKPSAIISTKHDQNHVFHVVAHQALTPKVMGVLLFNTPAPAGTTGLLSRKKKNRMLTREILIDLIHLQDDIIGNASLSQEDV